MPQRLKPSDDASQRLKLTTSSMVGSAAAFAEQCLLQKKCNFIIIFLLSLSKDKRLHENTDARLEIFRLYRRAPLVKRIQENLYVKLMYLFEKIADIII